MIYIIVLLLLLCFSLRYDINGKTKYRDECYVVMLIVFILIAGLRWRLMMDTPNYIYNFYHLYPSLEDFSFIDYPIGKDPFYVLINSFVKSAGGRFYVVQLIEATVINVLVFKYIKRHSSYLFTCLFFYAITCYLGYSMETMRASFSFVLCLFANDYILEKKWIKGYAIILLALMFHAQTIIMFIVPILFFMRLNKYGVIVLVCAFFIGYLAQKELGNYLELLDLEDDIADRATSYVANERFGDQRGNLNFLIVRIFPVLIYAFLSLLYIKKFYPQRAILVIEPFIMTGLFFLILQMKMQIAYRFVDYFRIHFVLIMAESFVVIAQKYKMLDRSLAYFRAIVLFMPFFMLIGYMRYLYIYTIHPYSSVIERSIDHDREVKYMHTYKVTPPADVNEY